MDHFGSFAKIWHSRKVVANNYFNYQVFYLLLDIEKISNLDCKLLAINKFNLFSINTAEYCKINASNQNENPKQLIESAIDIIKNAGCSDFKGRILLLTHPKILNFGFNPVSFFFYLNQNNEVIAVLADVNNTFGENHFYLLFNDDFLPIDKNNKFFTKKEFFVSPFFNREGDYLFNFDFSFDKIKITIDYFKDGKLQLNTGLVAKLQDLNDILLIKIIFKIPLMIFKVIFLIHYQAIKLLIKKVKYIKKPVISRFNITVKSSKNNK